MFTNVYSQFQSYVTIKKMSTNGRILGAAHTRVNFCMTPHASARANCLMILKVCAGNSVRKTSQKRHEKERRNTLKSLKMFNY